MADDRNEGMSSDDMLSAAREGANPSGSPISEPEEALPDDADVNGDEASELRELPERPDVPMVTSFEIERVEGHGSRFERAVLHVEGRDTARITSVHEKTDVFASSDHVRVTKIGFLVGGGWDIRAVEPGERPTKTTVFGNTKTMPHRLQDRVVSVRARTTGGVTREIARSEGPIASKALFLSGPGPYVVTAVGRQHKLAPAWESSSGTIGTSSTLRRVGWKKSLWRLEGSEPVPLSVALLHWHMLLGDTYMTPSPG